MFKNIAYALILSAGMIMSAFESHAAPSLATAEGLAAATGGNCASVIPANTSKKKNRIPMLGMSADCKYPIYDLKGELSDDRYFSHGGSVAWNSGDLIGRVEFIKPEDAKSGNYKCDWVCKETRTGNIVGLNPAYRDLFKK